MPFRRQLTQVMFGMRGMLQWFSHLHGKRKADDARVGATARAPRVAPVEIQTERDQTQEQTRVHSGPGYRESRSGTGVDHLQTYDLTLPSLRYFALHELRSEGSEIKLGSCTAA
jgi:hypothetical protein